MVILEVCASSLQSARNAEVGGAHCIELCQNLEQDGITPSYGLIRQVNAELKLPISVLIRPRPGGHVYSEEEIQIMRYDIEQCRQLHCHGVTFGILDRDAAVNVEACGMLIEAAGSMRCTFSRAFDDCPDMYKAVDDIVSLGFSRILTSGGAHTVMESMPTIRDLVRSTRGRVTLVAASGITVDNVRTLIDNTGVTAVHASAKSQASDAVNSSRIFASERWRTSLEIVRSLVSAVTEYDRGRSSEK